jgi:hypothetical protein
VEPTIKLSGGFGVTAIEANAISFVIVVVVLVVVDFDEQEQDTGKTIVKTIINPIARQKPTNRICLLFM